MPAAADRPVDLSEAPSAAPAGSPSPAPGKPGRADLGRRRRATGSGKPGPGGSERKAPTGPGRSDPAAPRTSGAAGSGEPDPATPGEPDPEEKGPLRRCVATRTSLPKDGMLRFVLGPGRELVPDLGERLPGRGMWLSARADVLEAALKRGAFAKAARGQVQAPPDLSMRIEAGLRHRLRDLVGFARRAGQAVCGFQQAREWLQSGRAGLVVQASDGSASERARLVGSKEVPVVAALSAAELGSVFGRDHTVHVAVARGRLAQEIAREAARLGGFTSAVESVRG
ncbi:RNA-binding protein [Roseomonas sp. BN140053]|uniref:RNA-binding protein n=1 Tax=Roseomonas sp. BN140053 TaxID=3391898 RepID=UPI0039E7CC5A